MSSESLFYYFRLDDQAPENHLLRLVDRHSGRRLGGAALNIPVELTAWFS